MKTRKIGFLAICLAIGISLSAIVIGLAEPDLQNRTQATTAITTDGTLLQSPSYEELKSIGFDPQQRRIDGNIDIKQPYGYNGFEFVGFYIDWNNNGIFENNELIGTSNVYISNTDDNTRPFLPISYSVSSNVEIPYYGSWPILNARAILSFNDPPTGPNYIPQYGNIINIRIRNPYFWAFPAPRTAVNTVTTNTDTVR